MQFHVGDKVKIISGPYRGMTGKVFCIFGTNVEIKNDTNGHREWFDPEEVMFI